MAVHGIYKEIRHLQIRSKTFQNSLGIPYVAALAPMAPDSPESVYRSATWGQFIQDQYTLAQLSQLVQRTACLTSAWLRVTFAYCIPAEAKLLPLETATPSVLW